MCLMCSLFEQIKCANVADIFRNCAFFYNKKADDCLFHSACTGLKKNPAKEERLTERRKRVLSSHSELN